MSLTLSFDIGYASIGWCVLSAKSPAPAHPDILGTGVVTFPTDDCLASTRRNLRRTRRHIRSTRQRIERLKKWLLHRGVLTRAELDKPGHPAPFLLAAAALEEHRTLNAWELWTVLRWYAHNRGYDGNSRWANDEGNDEDTEKERAASELMEKYATKTMCGTVCRCLGLDPAESDVRISSTLPYKTLNAAYPRKIVTAEVQKLLQMHQGKINGLDAEAVYAIFTPEELKLHYERPEEEDQAFEEAGIDLKKRYCGGLLFGQLVPRFDNRIISRCPITWAKTYDLVSKGLNQKDGVYQDWHEFLLSTSDKPVDSGKSQEDWARIFGKKAGLIQKGNSVEEAVHQIASEMADKFAKVPAKKCLEFLEYRFARILANIRLGDRPLPKDLRRALFLLAQERGHLTEKEISAEIQKHTPGAKTNLDGYFKIHPDAEDALTLDPVANEVRMATGSKQSTLYPYWSLLGEGIREQIKGEWRKGRSVSLSFIRNLAPDNTELAASFQTAFHNLKPSDRKKAPDLETFLLKKKAGPDGLSGRAPFARPVLRRVKEEILAGFDPTRSAKDDEDFQGNNKEEDGVLHAFSLPGSRVNELLSERPLDQLTNNHLVRHRLLILERLVKELIEEFAGNDASRVGHVVIEVARELKEYSGKDIQEIKKELGGRLANFKSAVEHLQKFAPHLPLTGGLIRKCRIAMDLDWTCPFTGKCIKDPTVFKDLEREHIVPFASRQTNSLHSLVLTFKEVNRWKGKRTARQFIIDEGGKQVPGRPDLTIMAEKNYEQFVKDLDTKGHPDDHRRKKARKALLLTTEFNERDQGFTEGSLTQSSHLIKLAMRGIKQQLPAARVLVVPGVVTGEIRKSWNLLGCLGDPTVCGVEALRWIRDYDHRDGNFAFDHKREYPVFEKTEAVEKKVKGKMTPVLPDNAFSCANEDCEAPLLWPSESISKATCPSCRTVLRRVPKAKNDIRPITHLHHALDAVTIASVAHYFPTVHNGENIAGKLWKAVVSRNKTKEETTVLNRTGLYNFCNKLDDKGNEQTRAYLRDLPTNLKNQLISRLSEYRVAQHIPSDRSGTKAKLLTWGIVGIIGESALIIQRPNRGLLELDSNSTQRRWKDKPIAKETAKLLKEHGHLLGSKERRLVERGIYKITTEKLTRLLGPASPKDDGKLAAIKGSLVIGDNFAVALDPAPAVLIPFHKVHQILSARTMENGGKPPRLIRNGTIIKVSRGTWKGVWRVLSVKNSDAYGISLDLASPHGLNLLKGNAKVPQMVLDGLEILPKRYSGHPMNE